MRTGLWRKLLGQYRPIAVSSYAAQVSYMQLCVTKTARAMTGGGRAAALNSVTAASFHLTTSVAFCVAASVSVTGCVSSLFARPSQAPGRRREWQVPATAAGAHLQWRVLAGDIGDRDVGGHVR